MHHRSAVMAGLATAQDGVVVRRQLLDAGISAAAVSRLVASGGLHEVHRGVYAVGHLALGRRGRERAAVMACGSGSLLSHRSAAHLWELHAYDGRLIEVTTTRVGVRSPAGVRLRRTTRLPVDDVARRDGLPVTSANRTLADLAAVVSLRGTARALERAEALHLLDVPSLLRSSARRPGGAAIRRVLASWSPEATRSDLEDLLLELIRGSTLPEPEVNVMLHGFEVDLLWRRECLVAEADSLMHHATRGAMERDRRRDAVLAARGYRVLRFTWMQVTRRPAEVRRALAVALA